MKRSINELTGYTIDAVDGTKGIVRDFLFDEEEWNIRYLEADLGLIFSGRKVLIPNKFLKSPDWSSHSFPVAIDKSSIEECPELAENLPVSRRYEEELNKYYESNDYWSNTYVVPVGQPGLIHTPRPIPIPNKIIDEQEIDTSLRSFKELKGYKVIGSDGQIGQVDDIIVDDMSWQIVYLVVDTSNWMEWSKKVCYYSGLNLATKLIAENTSLEFLIVVSITDLKTEKLYAPC